LTSFTFILILRLIFIHDIIAQSNYEIERYCKNFKDYEKCAKDFNLNPSKELIKRNSPIRIPIIPYKKGRS
tara:strand:+ start:162 stop:374 length:213 start_codon:yes stop_codon:yes gene_type:complete